MSAEVDHPDRQQSVEDQESPLSMWADEEFQPEPDDVNATEDESSVLEMSQKQFISYITAGSTEGVDPDDTVGMYLAEVSSIPLLTAQREVELAIDIESGRNARENMLLLNPRELKKQKKQLIQEVRQGWNAREELIVSNTRLVISVAKKYMGRGVPFIDLIQEGNIGLMRSAKKFDYKRGHKFSTYATWWIRQAVTRAIADHGRTIRIPVHMSDSINKMMSVEHRLRQEYKREPTTEELAIALDEPEEKISKWRKFASVEPLSLEDGSENDDEEATIGDFITDETDMGDTETAVMQNILRQQIDESLDQLTDREKEVIQLRFGLLDGQAYTLEEIGRHLKVTRERVRQIEADALKKLRNPYMNGSIEGYRPSKNN